MHGRAVQGRADVQGEHAARQTYASMQHMELSSGNTL